MADEIQSLLYSGEGSTVLRSASSASRLILPRAANYGVNVGISGAGDYNYAATIPASATFVSVIRSEGLANMALRFFMLRNSSTLTAGTDTVTMRAWGARAMSLPGGVYYISGQYLWEYTLGLATKLAVNAAIIPASDSTDSSYVDLLTASASNPHPSVDTTFGQAGSGRIMRFDMLGWPLLILQGSSSGTNVGWNGEWWQY